MHTHLVATLTVAALLIGCTGADDTLPRGDERHAPTDAHDEEGPVGGVLDHTLRFEALGQEGYRSLTVAPDGSAEGEVGAAGTFAFDLSDADVSAITRAVDGAELTEQPPELRGEQPDLGDEIYRFEYGDTRLEAEWLHSPTEIRDLGGLLLQTLVDALETHGPQA